MAKQHGKHPDTALAQNRKARHDYAVEETYEAGIALTGRKSNPFAIGGST
ncbi:hypothetical protein TUA1478L_03780 [Lactiplantibacillus plantarum]